MEKGGSRKKDGVIRLMEVCGTHTAAIAKHGIKQLLPENVKLLSGPGCPVCVTPPELIDAVLKLAGPGKENSDKEPSGIYRARAPYGKYGKPVIATYGDMLRVPGSVKGDSLMHRRALGAEVRIVYSPLDSLRIAEECPEREVVFLGVGFETSAPGTAAAIKAAYEKNIRNFSVFSMLKRLEPAVRALAEEPDFNVQGFICPGHVAAVIGEEGMRFFSEELHFPAVISGFEAEDLLKSIAMLLRQIRSGEAFLQNEYASVVRPEGNRLALEMTDRYFETRDSLWRGLGSIEGSAYGIRDEYEDFNAEKKFGISIGKAASQTSCRCGEVIRGILEPQECPLFGTGCVPEDPEGPCMVSSEGACAAAWKYSGV